MPKISEKYGKYYNDKLSEYFDGLSLGDNYGTELIAFITSLQKYGVTEILFDIDNESKYTDTMFFETAETTNFKELMMLIISKRPHEFTEETDHHYRMWFD